MRIFYPGFWRLLLSAVLLTVVGAQLWHEAGHWTVLQLSGRQPLWGVTSLIQLWDKAPNHPAEWTAIIDPIDGDQRWLHLGSLPISNLEWVVFLAFGPPFQLLAVGVLTED